MTIAEADKIDLMFRDDEGHAVLVITDHLDWEDVNEGDHLMLLQEKINTYLEFVDSGQLTKARPDWKNLSVIIQIDAVCDAGKKALEFYRAAGKAIAKAGMSLVLHVPDSGTTTRF